MAKGTALPLFAFLGGATFLFLFRSELRDLINRLRKLPTGIELDPATPKVEQRKVERAASKFWPKFFGMPGAVIFDAAAAFAGPMAAAAVGAIARTASSNSSGPTEPGEVKLKDLPGLDRSQAIGDLERLLHVALEKEGVPQEDRVDRLIRLLSEARIEADFERIYRVIYGSQIRGLRMLGSEGRISLADARKRFDAVISDYPGFYKEGSFDEWLAFLTRMALVAKTEEDMLALTPLGQDFLVFLARRGYSDAKPY
ncbi:hypothetical protein GCM10011320_31310 [Neoroseomonas lacus]|uniref:Uncharacterized protein n=1 Tax=Neoroseomonas lacus TaxID=287609 RepID=A0A917KNF6_9PROT|nr:hypothetical protein GCM10011320_31310 [Neoroseomonas lacus]